MQCPKCHAGMEEVESKGVTIDRCLECQGLWFDRGEAEQLSDRLVADYIDTGDPEVGEAMDEIEAIKCPRCSQPMRRFFDLSESQLQFEECDEHGKFFDAR